MMKFEPLFVIQTLIAAFFAVTFLQSGADKVLDAKGNLSFLRSHFSKSPLRSSVPLLFVTLTLLELCTGILNFYALWNNSFVSLGSAAAGFTLVCLLLGQRLAKDYAGAASLVGYFIVSLIGLWSAR